MWAPTIDSSPALHGMLWAAMCRIRDCGATSHPSVSISNSLKKKQSTAARRYPWRRAVFVFLAALAVKAAVLYVLHDHPLLQPRGDMDTTVYVALAQHAPNQPYFVSPLY